MNDPVTPKVRTGRAATPGSGSHRKPDESPGTPSPEVARAKALYLRALRSRLQDGSYMSPRRVDTALQRLLDAVQDDLPQDPIE